MKLLVVILFPICCCLTARSQTTGLLLKVDTVKILLSRVDSFASIYSSKESFEDTIYAINGEITSRLAIVLTNNETTKEDLDSLLGGSFLQITHSKDKRLWIVNWPENAGGTWKSNINLIQYRTVTNKPKVAYQESIEGDDSDQNLFNSNSGTFDKIYKLNSPTKDLYLCVGSGVDCTFCEFSIASVVELTKDSINFNYPIFPFMPETFQNSAFSLGADLGDIKKFEFNQKTQALTYTYLTDKNTPVQSVKQKRITRTLTFDGKKFVWARKYPEISYD